MSITKPTQGDPTKKSLIDAVIDELEAQAASTYAVSTLGIISNGSFELGTVTPSGWTFTAQGSGTGAIDATTSTHGTNSFKMESAGGGGANGGGTLEMSEFVECTPLQPLRFRWSTKSSVAGVKNLFQVRWFSTPDEGDYISTTTVWSSDNNPTSWTHFASAAWPPSTARYFKVVLTGCDSTDTTAGSAWFDDIGVGETVYRNRIEFTTAGTFTWLCPAGVYFARVTMVGGGGAGASNPAGGGGGGGGTGRSAVQVTPGTVYTVVIGAGAANSTFDTSVVIGNAGASATTGTGGAGGSATGNEIIAGAAGANGNGSNVGGTGGPSSAGCGGAVNGFAGGGAGFRGGGGAGAGSTGTGGAGGAGYGLIEY